ncbi:MAG TPA: hypothetical protein VK752_17890 [Bryobacteraceae bacterium]|nr:hypothetical protein [Bryobacteraceae bacterium]
MPHPHRDYEGKYRRPHSVRGFISTGSKKHGVNIESAKNQAGERTYKTSK